MTFFLQFVHTIIPYFLFIITHWKLLSDRYCIDTSSAIIAITIKTKQKSIWPFLKKKHQFLCLVKKNNIKSKNIIIFTTHLNHE